MSEKRSHHTAFLVHHHVSVPCLASEKPDRPRRVRRYQLQYQIQENIYITCRRFVPSGRRFPLVHALKLLTSQPNLDNGFFLSQISDVDEFTTSSSKSWALVLRWMHDCLRNHPRCNEWSTSQWWPTRLLDIESHTDALLVETSIATSLGPYLTSSHRWGAAEFVTLTTENIENMKRGISYQSLPRTFLDARYSCQTV